MKRITFVLLSLLICLSITGCGNTQMNSLKIDLNKQTKRAEAAESALNELTEDYDALLAQVDELNEELKKQKDEAKRLNDTIDTYQTTLEELETSLKNSASNEQLQAKIDTLTADLNNYKAVNEILNQQIAELQANKQPKQQINYPDESYIELKFWTDGNNYKSDKITWYSDPYCSKAISGEVIIISPTVSEDRLNNGYTVYTCLSSTNCLVYSSRYPWLQKAN